MNPAMAFAGDDGVPILISAKCTHLGCTVGNEVNKEGKILCPCHVSFFDIKTGMPNADAPAKTPLPFLSWAIMDKQGNVVASRDEKGKMSGNTSAQAIENCNLYVCRSEEVKVS
jgi:Rieske Fe-S protein